MNDAYVLFDIGGTKTRIAVSEDLRSFEEPEKFDTPLDFNEGMRTFQDAAAALLAGREATVLAGGIRGPLNREKTCVVNDPGAKILDWVGKPLSETLALHFDAPVYLENDAAIAALGEAHAGAGKKYRIVAYHTVSTGVGGARVVNGRIDESSIGFEPGQQVLDIDRSIFGASTPHTLEQLVSGAALEKRRGVKPYEIPQSDPVWDELAGYLARGLKNTITYWSPDVIVLGGSMIVGDPRILLTDIVRHTEEVLGGLVPVPPIVDAELKDVGGLYGAMALIRDKQKEKEVRAA